MELSLSLFRLMVRRSSQGPPLGRSESGIVRLPTPTFSSMHFPHVPCPACPTAASLELKSEKTNAHSRYVMSVANSPDGKTIVSGSVDQTIKVWDCAAAHSNLFLSAYFLMCRAPPAPQLHLWSSRARRRTPTAATSPLWPSLQTGRRLCPAHGTRRSKSGI